MKRYEVQILGRPTFREWRAFASARTKAEAIDIGGLLYGGKTLEYPHGLPPACIRIVRWKGKVLP